VLICVNSPKHPPIIPLGLMANRSLGFNVHRRYTVSHSLNRGGAKATYAFQHLSFDCMSSRRRASKGSPWLGQVDYPRNVHSPDERDWMVRGQVLELYDAEVAHVGFFHEPPRVGRVLFRALFMTAQDSCRVTNLKILQGRIRVVIGCMHVVGDQISIWGLCHPREEP
jgi:hypothetical protein